MLPNAVVLAMQLNRAVEAGSIERRLNVTGDGHPIFEADDGTLVDAEQAARLLTECAPPQVAGEAVCQAEVALEQRQTHRRRQVDDDHVRFRLVQDGVVVSRLRPFSAGGGARRFGRVWKGLGRRGARGRIQNQTGANQAPDNGEFHYVSPSKLLSVWERPCRPPKYSGRPSSGNARSVSTD